MHGFVFASGWDHMPVPVKPSLSLQVSIDSDQGMAACEARIVALRVLPAQPARSTCPAQLAQSIVHAE